MADPGVVVTVTTDSTSTRELADLAPDILQAELDSQKFWNSLNPDRRSVVLLLVRDALQRLMLDVDKWVPDCVVPGGEDWIDLRVRFQPHYLDEVAERQTIDNISAHQDAIEGLRQLVADFSSD